MAGYGIPKDNTDATLRAGRLASAVNGLSGAVDDLDLRAKAVKTTADSAKSVADAAKAKNDSQDQKLTQHTEQITVLQQTAKVAGPTGAPGEDGTDGRSAYEVAVAGGFSGTESEWLASLKGDPGDDGIGGHTILDGAGEAMPFRSKLLISGPPGSVTHNDDEAGDTTGIVFTIPDSSGHVILDPTTQEALPQRDKLHLLAGTGVSLVAADNEIQDVTRILISGENVDGVGGEVFALRKMQTVTTFYSPVLGAGGGAGSEEARQFMPAMRIHVKDAVTLTGLGTVGHASASNGYRVGLYTDSGGKPGTLIVESGLIFGPGTPVGTVPDTPLTPGAYWVAVVFTVYSSNQTFASLPQGSMRYAVAASTATGVSGSGFPVHDRGTPADAPLPTTFVPASLAGRWSERYIIQPVLRIGA